MKHEKQKAPSLALSGFDVEAILAALPIVENYPADTPEQCALNQMACMGVKAKILSARKDFTNNELRVIGIASCMACDYLSGKLPEVAELIENAYLLKTYFLSFNRLSAYFRPQLDALYK